MKTLNEQYQLIKEGKGHKGVFLNEAKRQFPHYIRNASTFEETTTILKQKGIINENLVGLSPINKIETAKKESFEFAFEKFLEEAKDPQIKAKEVKEKKLKSQEEDEKAELKKTSKQVEDDLKHGYDHSDKKNLDNVIYGQLMKGYYTEMKDPKNEDKTVEQIRDIVLKNLEKDSMHYVKDGQFGVKGLGYTTEHPGLGTPKEPTGKYKASGYGDLKESIQPINEEESKLRNIIRSIINEELEEAYQLKNINLKSPPKDREERDPQDTYIYLKSSTEELLKKNQHLRILRNPQNPEEIKGVAIRSRLVSPQNLKKLPYDINPMFIGFLNTANNIGGNITLPTKDGSTDNYTLLNNVNVGREGRLSFFVPNPKKATKMDDMMESLKESIEKELAAINKEAEHEILASKLEKIDAAIEKRQSQLNKLDEDEDMKNLTDAKKVKEISKDIKALEKAKAKIEKMMHKGKGKKKEVIEDGAEDPMMDEMYLENTPDEEAEY